MLFKLLADNLISLLHNAQNIWGPIGEGAPLNSKCEHI